MLKNFYSDAASLVHSSRQWAYHGGVWHDGIFAGEFAFGRNTGAVDIIFGSRLVCGTTI